MFPARLSHRAFALGISLVGAGAGSLAAQARAPDAQKRPAAHPAQRDTSEESEHTVAAARVPAAVRDAVRHAYPNATVTKWSTEVENRRTVYEAETRDGATHRDMLVGADGGILEVETQVTLAQLPAAVRTAATANGQHVDRAEVVVAGRDTTYEMKIRGRQGELKLRANGQPVPATAH